MQPQVDNQVQKEKTIVTQVRQLGLAKVMYRRKCRSCSRTFSITLGELQEKPSLAHEDECHGCHTAKIYGPTLFTRPFQNHPQLQKLKATLKRHPKRHQAR